MTLRQQTDIAQKAECQYYEHPITNLFSITALTLTEIHAYITSGKAREATEALRAIPDKDGQRRYKAQHFDYCLFSGTFTSRTDSGLTRHSGLICLDFDDLTAAQVGTLRARLLADPYFETMLLFTSPSGRGLKWVITIDIDLYTHAEWFKALQMYVRTEYGVETDRQCRNVSRACYLPYDPSCYICPELAQQHR